MVVAFSNDGVAGVPGLLRVTLKDAGGRTIAGGCLDAGHPQGARIRQAAFPVPNEFEGQSVFLSAALEGKAGVRRPVQWACEQPVEADGSFKIVIKRKSDTGWRKGI